MDVQEIRKHIYNLLITDQLPFPIEVVKKAANMALDDFTSKNFDPCIYNEADDVVRMDFIFRLRLRTYLYSRRLSIVEI